MFPRLLLFFFLILTLPLFAFKRGNSTHGKRQLNFIENKGQVTDQFGEARSDIDFKIVAGNGLNIFIGKGAMHYQWVKPLPAAHARRATGADFKTTAAPADNEPLEMYRMDVELLGTNPDATITVENKTAYYERYYLPSVGNNGAVANAFGKITYHNIYPGIDWVFYFNSDRKLEHDFIIHSGGKVADIKLKYRGATQLKINRDGSLTATTPYGVVHERAPYTFQEKNKKKVASRFVLRDDVLMFVADEYNGTLIIDPSIEWGTYFGGTEYDDLQKVQVAPDGKIYTCGATSSNSNIATTGAFQTSFSGGASTFGSDAILAKFNQSGTCLWATYYGGSNVDLGRGIAFDTSGNIYLAGYSNSTTGITTPGSHKAVKTGSNLRTEAFLVKFDTAGGRIWGTYYGGMQYEENITVASDNTGHIYITGNTNSTADIATAGAYQSSLAGTYDIFLAKFNTAGNLIWGTYYGGNSNDYSAGIAVDTFGDIYLTGNTFSTTGIATTGAYQTVNSGAYDAFLAKFNSSGQRQWGTYLGGTGADYGQGLTCDDLGNVYLIGTTTSNAGITSAGSYQSSYGGGGSDGYLAKFSGSGILAWSTYYGGAADDASSCIHRASNGAIYISGVSTSTTNISTPGSIQPAFAGGEDIYLSRFTPNGMLEWGSYIGGPDSEMGYSISSDNNTNLYLTGRTNGAVAIATPNSHQSTLGGGPFDGFLIRIKDCILPLTPDTISGSISACAGTMHTYSVSSATATSYTWILPSGWTGSSTTDTIEITFESNSGILKAVAVNDCDVSDTITLAITVNPLPTVPVIVQTGNTLGTAQPYNAYQWNQNGLPIAGAIAPGYEITASGVYSVTVINENNCSVTSIDFDAVITTVNRLMVLNGINVYPNPVQDVLYIKLENKTIVSISSIDGKVMETYNLLPGKTMIDFNAYANGMYFLRFTSPSGTLLGTQKIIKDIE